MQLLDVDRNQQLVEILERHLRAALLIEEAREWSGSAQESSWWRTAIDDTDQDQYPEYKDQLLLALPGTLEAWIELRMSSRRRE